MTVGTEPDATLPTRPGVPSPRPPRDDLLVTSPSTGGPTPAPGGPGSATPDLGRVAKMLRPLLIGGAVLLLAGVAVLAVLAGAADAHAGRVFATGVLLSGAALAVGSLLGFLFAVPRFQDGDRPAAASAQLVVNTNLEQVSDWLTKILVGVGLIQLGAISSGLGRLVAELGPMFQVGEAGPAVAGGLLVFYSIAGFLLGYIITRTSLSAVLTQFINLRDRVETSDRQMREAAEEAAKAHEEADRANRKLSTVTDAVDLAVQLLRGEADDRVPLAAALRDADHFAREVVFKLAQQQRHLNWDWQSHPDPVTREKKRLALERAIPVFRALVEADPLDARHHGELGMALKDHSDARHREAAGELRQAIEMAAGAEDSGGGWWELNLALVEAAADVLAGAVPSPAGRRQEVLGWLRAACRRPVIADVVRRALVEEVHHASSRHLRSWLTGNDVSLEDVVPG